MPRRLVFGLLCVLAACNRPQPPAATDAAGSAPTGVPVRPDTAAARRIIQAVVLCRTTEAELRTRLGAPNREGFLHGERVVTWFVRTESPESFLTVLLDTAGVVVDDYWDLPAETPVVLANRCAAARR